MSRMSISVVVAIVLAGSLAGCRTGSATPGCAAGSSPRVAIDVDEPVALADQPLHIQVTGLDPGATAAVVLRAVGYHGEDWLGHATFTADGEGVVDLTRDEPDRGTYRGVDGMGLFWSMDRVEGEPDRSMFFPRPPPEQPAFEMQLAVCAEGQELARAGVTRQWMGEGVTHRHVRPERDGVVGELFLPPADVHGRSGVLLLGGSDSYGMDEDAALLASHGFPALALRYFGAAGIPEELRNVPLEYFAEAAALLAELPEVAASSVAVLGYSRGTEAALLLAQHFPELTHAVVVYAPSYRVNIGFPNGGAAWTLEESPVPRTRIPLDNVAGPVLAIAGGDDAPFWPAASSAELIVELLESEQVPYPHRALIYEDAGHGVGVYPYFARCVVCAHPVTGDVDDWGGTRETNEAARRDSWPQVLEFLSDLSVLE